MKNAVDDQLLDLNPALAEQLMLAFKSVSSEKDEEWSQTLTTCRRLLKDLADELYPPSKEKHNERALGQANYINRLWTFMDNSIQSETNRELVKAHVDLLGSWMERINKLSSKGVHAELQKLEAVKAVFHVYLMIADILEYIDSSKKPTKKPDINKATLDEIEALLGVKRSIAKEIIKVRVQQGSLNLDSLSKIRGVGPKTLQKASDFITILITTNTINRNKLNSKSL